MKAVALERLKPAGPDPGAEPLAPVAAEAQPLQFGAIPVTETQAFPPAPQPQCWAYVTLNAEIALLQRRCQALQSLLLTRRARVSIDSQWLWWALRRKYPQQPLAKLSGSDLIHVLAADCARHGQRLLLLGATASANASAVQALGERWPGLQVAGFSPAQFALGSEGERQAQAQSLAAIQAWQPHYVVLGLGPTKEYRLAWQLLPALDGTVTGVLCFGGAIDLASGRVRRAPLPWQRLGLECVYRLLQQPSRAWRFAGAMRLLPRLLLGRY